MRRAIQQFNNYRDAALDLAEKHGLPFVSINEPESWFLLQGIETLANHYNIEEDWILQERSRKAADMRHAFFFVACREFEIKPLRIAQAFDSSHTTILNAITKVQGLLDINDAVMHELVQEITEVLNA